MTSKMKNMQAECFFCNLFGRHLVCGSFGVAQLMLRPTAGRARSMGATASYVCGAA